MSDSEVVFDEDENTKPFTLKTSRDRECMESNEKRDKLLSQLQGDGVLTHIAQVLTNLWNRRSDLPSDIHPLELILAHLEPAGEGTERDSLLSEGIEKADSHGSWTQKDVKCRLEGSRSEETSLPLEIMQENFRRYLERCGVLQCLTKSLFYYTSAEEPDYQSGGWGDDSIYDLYRNG
ncbi:uncharacterized protein [Watersipora subatra]|uniref:uncharacterized protein n=1 Tax=Watersipora subatra TaxID=2589382 RepID=UPI00355B2787